MGVENQKLKKAEETGPEPTEVTTESVDTSAPEESNLRNDTEAGTGKPNKKKKKKNNRKKKKKNRDIQHNETVASTSETSTTNTNVPPAASTSYHASRDLTFISTGNNAIPIILDAPTTVFAGSNATIHAGAGANVYLGYGALLRGGEGNNVDLFTEVPSANPPEYQSNASPSPHVDARDREVTPTPSGSAETFKNDVKIRYGLEWTDTKGSIQVPRHTPVKELKEIPPVESMKEAWAPEAPVRVSPAKSAGSDTFVTVEGSYQELLRRMKEELFEELEQKFDAKVERKVQSSLARAFAPERGAFGLMLRRNLEDFVLLKMKANIPEAEGESYATVIRRFRGRYRIDEFSDNDFNDLAYSARRREANTFAHQDVNSQDFKKHKDSLMEILKQGGDLEELEKYQRYYEFAIGKIGFAER